MGQGRKQPIYEIREGMKPGKALCCRFLFTILGVESAQSLEKYIRLLLVFMQLTKRNIAIT